MAGRLRHPRHRGEQQDVEGAALVKGQVRTDMNGASVFSEGEVTVGSQARKGVRDGLVDI